ncbi:MAG: glutamine synthetase type III, partial [Flavobacteriales bacterium]
SALKVWKNKDVHKMFEALNVLTHEEIHARYEIEVETYVRKREIEARVTTDIAVNHILPAALDYQTKLIDNVLGLKEIFSAAESKNLSRTQTDIIKQISTEINALKDALDKMNAERAKASKLDIEKQAEVFSNKVKPLMDVARSAADNLELITEDEAWPLPKMRELLFTR